MTLENRVRTENSVQTAGGATSPVYIGGDEDMTKFLAKFRKDENGASLIEYSLLIGLITVASVTLIALMGPWVATQWQALVTATGA